MKEKYTFEYLEAYLDQALTAGEKNELENDLQADVELKAELDRHQQTRQLVHQMAVEETRTKVGKAFRKSQANKRNIARPFLRIAAGVAIILALGLGYLLTQQPANPQELAANHFEPFPDRLTTMGAESDALGEAMNAYNQGDYAKASDLLQQIPGDHPQQELVGLYMGIAAIQTGNEQQAISLLSQLQENSANYREVASWYLALTYLQQGEEEKARPLLQALADADAYQASNAQELLDSLK